VTLLIISNSLLRSIGHACLRRDWMQAHAERLGIAIAAGRNLM
jgi:hypothetical protein